MPRVSFQPLGDSWALVLVLLAALAAGLFLFAANDKGVSRARRRFELGLRMASVLLFAILFTRPALVTTVKEELPASVAFLCDVSESMAIRDGENSESRYETMRRTLDAAGDKLRALCEKFDVYAVGFGQGSDPIPVEDGRYPSSPPPPVCMAFPFHSSGRPIMKWMSCAAGSCGQMRPRRQK